MPRKKITPIDSPPAAALSTSPVKGSQDTSEITPNIVKKPRIAPASVRAVLSKVALPKAAGPQETGLIQATDGAAAAPKLVTPKKKAAKAPNGAGKTSTLTPVAMPIHAPSVETDTLSLIAYFRWINRGRPLGSPDVDWYQAQEELRAGK